ncbi:nuclease-related domain-containing protein [Nocardioides ochotonae]|uniref:nuclease-related domain-containing protein n=1 Tax=Nocardioides ochotonae TaxID=2685869 RepID=UPI00140C9AF0|nr:nuclease-related domain-containing protein [Nocardioides ochotonae]
MSKHHPYSRLEFRRRLKFWLRRNVGAVAGLTTGFVVSVGIIVVVLVTVMPESSFTWWLLGCLPTALIAAYLHLLHLAFLAHDAEAIWHVRGAWGEDNTRDELQRAKRKRLVWDWVDSVGLQIGDIDHLVVTRNGGLVAIDSKWRSTIKDATEMARAAQKVRLRAEGLTRDLLKGESRGTRRARGVNPLSVTSVVVLWGAAQHGVPHGANIDGIEFIAGRRLVDWLAALEGQPVDAVAAAEVLRQVKSKRDSAAEAQVLRQSAGRAT